MAQINPIKALASHLPILGFVLFATAIATPFAVAQETIFDPSDLAPRSIFDDLRIVAPDFVKDILDRPSLTYRAVYSTEREYIIFSENADCDESGCVNIIMTLSDKTLANPVVFLTDDLDWYLVDRRFLVRDGQGICVSLRPAAFC